MSRRSRVAEQLASLPITVTWDKLAELWFITGPGIMGSLALTTPEAEAFAAGMRAGIEATRRSRGRLM